MKTSLQQISIFFLTFLLACGNGFLVITPTAQAADSSSPVSTTSLSCSNTAPAGGDELGEETEPVNTTDDDTDFEIPDSEGQTIVDGNSKNIKNRPDYETVKYLLDKKGTYDKASNTWTVCSEDANSILSVLPLGQDTQNYLNAVASDSSPITFANQQDKYALTGEPCTKFDGKLCDETKVEQPAYEEDATGQFILDDKGKKIPRYKKDDSGNLILDSKGKPQQDVDLVPKYYTEVWHNGKWDKPRADLRILNYLVYLVTPEDQGGAGRESIRVGKILENTKTSIDEFESDKNANDKAGAETNEMLGLGQEDDVGAVKSIRRECGGSIYSPHYYNPNMSNCIAQAVDITQIDKMRVTTKITTKSILGGTKVDWKFQHFPLEVAYQTNEGTGGITPALPPALDLYNGSQDMYGNALSNLLGEFGLDTNSGSSSLKMSNLGDLAKNLGISALSKALGIPYGSMQGGDAKQSYDAAGRAWIAKNMGLAPDALQNSSGDLTTDIGQATIENSMGLPAGSLNGNTPEEILTNIGRRYSERSIFNVADGTLDDSGSIKNTNDLYVRLGQGKLASVLSIPLDQLKKMDLGKISNSRSGFNINNYQVLNDELGIGDGPSSVSDTSDLTTLPDKTLESATQNLFNKKLSLNDWYRIVGIQTINSGIGTFNNKGLNPMSKGDGVDKDTSKEISISKISIGLGASSALIKALKPKSDSPFSCSNQILRFSNGNPLTNCSESNISTVLSGADQGLLISSGAFSQTELDTLKDRIASTVSSNRYYVSGDQSKESATVQVGKLYNEDISSNTGWVPVFQIALDRINKKIEDQLSGDDTTFDTSLLTVRKTLSSILGVFQQFDEGILDFLDQTGQGSGRSAGVRLTGTNFNFDDQGKIISVSVGKDPVNALVKGDMSVLQSIGRQVLGSAITLDPIAAHQIASRVGSTTNPTFRDTITYGITDSDLFDKGLTPGDFQRIFEKNMAQDVFSRVGDTELKRVLKKNPDLYHPKNAGLSNNEGEQETDYTNLINQAGTQYFAGIFNQIKYAASDVLMNNDLSKAILLNGPASSPEAIQDQIRRLEVYFQDDDASRAANKEQIEAIKNLFKKSQAGQDLDSSDDDSTQTTSSATCFSFKELKTAVKKKDQKAVSNVAQKAAGCQVDNALNIPAGSMYQWVKGDDARTLDSLSTIIGKRQASENGIAYISDADAQKQGEAILKDNAASFIHSLLPNNFKQTNSAYSISTDDIRAMLSGDTKPVLKKVAGQAIDDKLGWEYGTTAKLIDPTCYTTGTVSGVTTLTGKRPCTSKEVSDIRLGAVANEGLKQLGGYLGFPTTMSLNNAGSLLANYGISKLSEMLGLSQNSFVGSFTDLLQKNDPQQVMNGFNINDTPYAKIAVTLANNLERDRSGTYVVNDSVSSAIAALDTYIDNSRKSILSDLQNGNSPFWTDNSVIALQKADKDAFYSMMNQVKSYYPYFSDQSQVSYDNALTKAHKADGNIGNPYKQIVSDFKDQIKVFTDQYKVLFKDLKGAFTGLGSLTDVAKEFAKTDMAKKLTNDFIKDQLPESFQPTIDALERNGCTISALFMGEQTDQRDDARRCKSALGVSGDWSDVSVQDILTNPNFGILRGFLYDNLLAKSFGKDLERRFNLPDGTLRKIAIDPHMAKQVAIQAGMSMIADKLFASSNDESLTGKAKQAFHDAFLAGFYDSRTDRWTLNFKQDAALDSIAESLGNYINEVTNLVITKVARKLGLTISQADRQKILNGDLATIQYVSVQGLVSKINEQLDINIVIPDNRNKNKNSDITVNGIVLSGSKLNKIISLHGSSNSNSTVITATGNSSMTSDNSITGEVEVNGATVTVSEDAANSLAQSIQDCNQPGVECVDIQSDFDPNDPIFTSDNRMTDGIVHSPSTTEKATQQLKEAKNRVIDEAKVLYKALPELAKAAGLAYAKEQVEKFGFSYSDVRDLVTGGSYNRRAIDEVTGDAINEYINTICGDISQEGSKACREDVVSPEHSADLIAVRDQAARDYSKEVKKEAAKNLRYQALDIAAQKIDKNIPRGFSRAIIEGNRAVKTKIIGDYIWNRVVINSSIIRELNLNEAGVAALKQIPRGNYNAHDIENFTKIAGYTKAMDTIQNWASDQLRPFGIDLPPDFTASFMNWAKSGFSKNVFDSVPDKSEFYGSNIRAMKDIGTQIGLTPLFNWVDSKLNLPTGSSYTVYQYYKEYKVAKVGLENARLFRDASGIKGATAPVVNSGVAGSTDGIGSALTSAQKIGPVGPTPISGTSYTYNPGYTTGAGSTDTLGNAVGPNSVASSPVKGIVEPGGGTSFTGTGSGPEVPGGDGNVSNASARLKAVKAAAITFIITTVFAKQLTAIDQALGLPSGVAAAAVGVGVAYLLSASLTGPLIGLAIAVLFGKKVTIEVRASSDGLYPLGPPNPPYEHPAPSSDYVQEYFDPQDKTVYAEGVMTAAQIKVDGTLLNSLQFSTNWGEAQKQDPDNYWISQVYTYDAVSGEFFPKGYLNDLDYFISAPAPYPTGEGNVRGQGYGPLEDRADTSQPINDANGVTYYKAKPYYRSGYFPDPHFFNHIHVRW